MKDALENELVSIIIPCHNHAHFICDAIDSLTRQTYPHIEIIVVDDGSTDATAQITKLRPNARYIRQKNLGLSRARNTGLAHSNGAYIVFLDADDRLLPDAIDLGIRALASRKDCALTFGRFVMVGISQDVQELSRDQKFDYNELLQRNFIVNPGSVLYRRWVFKEIGEFDEANSSAADYDLYLRVTRQFPILCHHQLVVQYRRHGANMSNDVRLMLASTLTALKKQRSHVEKSRELRAAYDMGVKFWRNCYGEPLINRMYEQFAKGHLIDAALDGYTLARFYPNRFLAFAKRMIVYLISFFRKEPPRS